jgi:hypothetical protein
MLLEAIIKNTWEEHEDYKDLKTGLAKVEEVWHLAFILI